VAKCACFILKTWVWFPSSLIFARFFPAAACSSCHSFFNLFPAAAGSCHHFFLCFSFSVSPPTVVGITDGYIRPQEEADRSQKY